jgi:nuclear transcription Y subunit beta
MDREQEGAQGQGLGDFEVKEQDRWLPIANGWLCLSPSHTSPFPCLDLSGPLRDTAAYGRVSCLRQSDKCTTTAPGFGHATLIRCASTSASHDLPQVCLLLVSASARAVPGPFRLTMSSDGSLTSPTPRHHRDSKTWPASDANIRNFAPVARIMKMALPENAKIAKEAKECMQECVSEFISFITSEGRNRQSLTQHPSANVVQHQRNASRRSARRSTERTSCMP